MPWFPPLLAAAYILNGFADFHVHIALLPRPLIVAVIGTVMAVALLWAVTRRTAPAATMATVIGVALLVPNAPLPMLLVLAGAAAVFVYLLELSGRVSWATWLHRLNLYAGLLLALVTISWSVGGGVDSVAQDLRSATAASGESDGPNVYLVLLDGYPRADTQRALFGVDPDPMLADLDRLGFDHYPDSFADYASTNQTIASMLYMDDLADAGLTLNAQGHAPQPAWRHALNANPAFDRARAAGYEVVAVTSGWDELALRSADRFIETGGISQFEQALIAENAYGALVEAIAPSYFGDQRRQRVTGALDAMTELSREDSPKRPRLVWVHVPAPHYPVLWRADGSPFPVSLADFTRYHRDAPRQELIEEYAGNLLAVNDLATMAIGEIVERDPLAAIVVFSDHGSLIGLGDADEIHASFLAAKTPGHPGLFLDEPTPRAILGRLFNVYLGPPGGR